MTKNTTQKGFTKKFLTLMSQIEKVCCGGENTLISIVTEDTDTVTFTGAGTKNSPLKAVSASVAPTILSNNGLTVLSGTTQLGQTIGAASNPGKLLHNTEIPLNTFSLFFNSAFASNSVSLVPNTISGATLNVGTDNHFGHSNITGNRVITLSTTTNINTVVDTGGYGASYFDSRYTFLNASTLALRNPSTTIVGLDLNDLTLTYNDFTTGSYPHTWSTLLLGGFRRKSGAITVDTITLPTVINSAAAVARVQFNVESGALHTITGFAAGFAVGTRFINPAPGSTINFYTDLLLGTDHGNNSHVNITYATKAGMYLMPIKNNALNTVTLGYGIYQEGTSDLNYFGGTVGIGAVTNHASAKFQVDSTTKGALFPRMTTAERDAIATPAEGLVIYNLTTHKLNVFTTGWEQITSS